MKKCFNITGLCYPDENYMVNLDSRLKQIKELVDDQKYFVINRARQYGKTTILWALKQYLLNEYEVISLDFQRMSSASFQNEFSFCFAFVKELIRNINHQKTAVTDFHANSLHKLNILLDNQKQNPIDLVLLFETLNYLCESSPKPVVLIIDEVDSASNNQVFLDFLALLRNCYLDRKDTKTFQSVILAGVYDIKNLRLKIRFDQEHRYNSPWNIAADFNVNLSFTIQDIIGMLNEYEQDHHTGMEISQMAQLIYDYTSGYPYLVSYICKMLDEKIATKNQFLNNAKTWSKEGITEAVRELMKISTTLFDDMRKKITDYPELRNMLYAILFMGKSFPYNPDNYAIDIASMFGYIKELNGTVAIANRIFEMRLYNLFISEEIVNSITYNEALSNKNQFINHDGLNMDLILQKFVEHYTDVYADSNTKFIEENGRRLFLLYLKPIINGVGNYYIEAQTRDMRRTDVIIDYRGHQYIIEMKIWHGEEYNKRGEQQLSAYLDTYHLTKGYLLSFNFNKNKSIGLKEIHCDDKIIIEAVV